MDIIMNVIKNYIAGGCKGDLHLSHSSIASLPEGLQVQRDLHLSYCSSLQFLPKNLKVRGSLVINKSAICSLPEDLEVIQDLFMSCTNISFLPDNLTLKGYLDLTGSAITSLPKNLKVGKCLMLCKTSIKKVSQLPLDLEVGSIISNYFDKDDFLDYWHKALQVNKKLSEDFDMSALDDF